MLCLIWSALEVFQIHALYGLEAVRILVIYVIACLRNVSAKQKTEESCFDHMSRYYAYCYESSNSPYEAAISSLFLKNKSNVDQIYAICIAASTF